MFEDILLYWFIWIDKIRLVCMNVWKIWFYQYKKVK